MSLWETIAPAAIEFPNDPSVFDHKEFVTGPIKEMVEAAALSRLPKDQRLTVVNLHGVV